MGRSRRGSVDIVVVVVVNIQTAEVVEVVLSVGTGLYTVDNSSSSEPSNSSLSAASAIPYSCLFTGDKVTEVLFAFFQSSTDSSVTGGLASFSCFTNHVAAADCCDFRIVVNVENGVVYRNLSLSDVPRVVAEVSNLWCRRCSRCRLIAFGDWQLAGRGLVGVDRASSELFVPVNESKCTERRRMTYCDTYKLICSFVSLMLSNM